MKRYASHFLFLSGQGYLKQAIVESEDGIAVRILPLTEEVEDVQWLPGAILLLPRKVMRQSGRNAPSVLPEWFTSVQLSAGSFQEKFSLLYFPAFDITTMQPVAGTRHRLLP